MALTNAPENFLPRQHTTPDFVPDSDTDVIGQDCYLEELTFTNAGVATATVTVLDKQTTPMPVVKDLDIDPGAPVVIRFDGRWCPGGVSWSASVADTIVGYMRVR